MRGLPGSRNAGSTVTVQESAKTFLFCWHYHSRFYTLFTRRNAIQGMASLQDQLLKAGLVDKNRANKAKKEKQKQANFTRRSGSKTVSAARVAAQQQQSKRVARDRELNLQKQNASNRKAIAAQIRQLIEVNRLDREQGEISYSFAYRNKIKNITVTDALKNQLTLGYLAIVTLLENNTRKFEIVPALVAQKIAQRDAGSVVQLNEKIDTAKDDDDPYADYQIPDDLTW